MNRFRRTAITVAVSALRSTASGFCSSGPRSIGRPWLARCARSGPASGRCSPLVWGRDQGPCGPGRGDGRAPPRLYMVSHVHLTPGGWLSGRGAARLRGPAALPRRRAVRTRARAGSPARIRSVKYGYSRTRSSSAGVSGPGLSQIALEIPRRPRSCTNPARPSARTYWTGIMEMRAASATRFATRANARPVSSVVRTHANDRSLSLAATWVDTSMRGYPRLSEVPQVGPVWESTIRGALSLLATGGGSAIEPDPPPRTRS
jgi:hypothetical protein